MPGGVGHPSADDALKTATPEEVREGTLAGVRWGVLARVGVETTALLSTVALARLISPSGFGHAVVAIAVIAVSQALVVEGFGTPLVQRKEITRAHLESTMLLSLLGGALLSRSCSRSRRCSRARSDPRPPR